MKIVYEGEIERVRYNAEDNHFFVYQILDEHGVPYEKEIREKVCINQRSGEDDRIRVVTVSVEDEYVEKVRILIGDELFYNEEEQEIHSEEFYKEELENFIKFHNAEYSKLKSFDQNVDFEKNKKLYEEKCDEFDKVEIRKRKMGRISVILFCLFFLFGCIWSIVEDSFDMDGTFFMIGGFLSFILFGVAFVAYAGFVGSSEKNDKIALKKLIYPTFKSLIAPDKFTLQGINKEFFERNIYFNSLFEHKRFLSENTVIGSLNDKKFITSEVRLQCFDSEGYSYDIFNGVFAHKEIAKTSCKRVWVNYSVENDVSNIEVIENNYVISEDYLNSEFKLKLKELGDKYKKYVSLYFEGNIVYIMIDNAKILITPYRLFMTAYKNEIILENMNMIKEYMELAELF
ncbi:MAG: hypothetical protein IJX99_04745 [Clostridia bacterium]|nr:hypothetical protein [Clostridia bacterium]